MEVRSRKRMKVYTNPGHYWVDSSDQKAWAWFWQGYKQRYHLLLMFIDATE